MSFGNPTVANGQPPVTTTCTPASGSLFPVGLTTVTCTATDALQRADSCTLAITIVPPPHLQLTSFLAFSGSITWGEDGTAAVSASVRRLTLRPYVQLPLAQTYPGALQQELASRYATQAPTVANGGKPGEAITDPTTFPGTWRSPPAAATRSC